MKPEGVAPADYANSIEKASAYFETWPEPDFDTLFFTDGVHSWTVGLADLELHRQLREADARFDRQAVPAVWAEYEAFIATGRYPYIDDVARFIADRHGIPGQVYHAAPGWGANGNLVKPLHHEIYLASRQYHAAELIVKEHALVADGWKPITELVPVERQHIFLSFAPDKKCRVAASLSNGGWIIFPPRNRVNAWSLSGLLDQHRAYEATKARGWTKSDSARPVMFKVAL